MGQVGCGSMSGWGVTSDVILMSAILVTVKAPGSQSCLRLKSENSEFCIMRFRLGTFTVKTESWVNYPWPNKSKRRNNAKLRLSLIRLCDPEG